MENQTLEEVLGSRVRAWRESRGWSQRELADHMNKRGYEWQQSTVAKTEAGQRPVRVNEAYALARVFEQSVTSLLAADTHGADVHAVLVAIDNVAKAVAELTAAEEEVERRKKAVEAAHAAYEEAQAKVAAKGARDLERKLFPDRGDDDG